MDADCQDEEKLPPIKCNIRNELMAVQMAQDSALKLIPRLRDSSTSEAAADEISKGIRRGQIKLLCISTMLSGDGRQVTAEDVEEIRYPDEFGQLMHGLPQNFGPLTTPLEPPPPRAYFMQDIDTPVSWETRNTGLIFEAGLTLENADVPLPGSHDESTPIISLNIDARLIELVQMKRFLKASQKQDDRAQYEQPQFRTAHLTTSLGVPSGKWQLIYVSAPVGKKPQIKLFLLRTTVLPLSK